MKVVFRPVPYASSFRPAEPVSVLAINGTSDPLVDYNSGAVLKGRQGYVLPAPETVKLWAHDDGCGPLPQVVSLPDRDPQDGCQAQLSTWSGGRNRTVVELCTIVGGGHTWPNGLPYLPRFLIGSVCRDFDASEMIWQFFAKHPKR
jgi:polyhydroxybutyrate depolymerase